MNGFDLAFNLPFDTSSFPKLDLWRDLGEAEDILISKKRLENENGFPSFDKRRKIDL